METENINNEGYNIIEKFSFKKGKRKNHIIETENANKKLQSDYFEGETIKLEDNLQLVDHRVKDQLLLSYVYFLNDCWTKHVAVGFHSQTLEPIVIIRCHRNKIKLCPLEWGIFFLQTKKNEKYKININNNFIVKKLASGLVQIIYKKQRMSLTEVEYETLVNLAEYINNVVSHYYSIHNVIVNYYHKLINECFRNDTHNLTYLNYFLPDNLTNVNINFNRLYFEMINLCKSKIETDYLTLKIETDTCLESFQYNENISL